MAMHTNDDIDAVKKALRQVLSVSPQLLFRASQQLGSDLQIESIQEQCAEKPNRKKLDVIAWRYGLCLLLGKALIQSGKAHLESEDFAAMSMFIR